MAGKQVVVRQVWASNLKSEFFHIQKVIHQYPFVSMDTEFPGTIFQSTLNKHLLCYAPDYTYYLMKLNVDMLKIIQLGLTFSDFEGNLPTLGTEYCYCWQFNFRDFDLQSDPHNVESIRLLEKQGTNFKMHREKGIDSRDFAKLVLSSGLIFNYSFTWITFHGAYDLAFFIKILTQQELPRNLQSFMGLMKFYLGVAVYDIKYILLFMACTVDWKGKELLVKTGSKNGKGKLLTARTTKKLSPLEVKKTVQFSQRVAGTNNSAGADSKQIVPERKTAAINVPNSFLLQPREVQSALHHRYNSHSVLSLSRGNEVPKSSYSCFKDMPPIFDDITPMPPRLNRQQSAASSPWKGSVDSQEKVADDVEKFETAFSGDTTAANEDDSD
ncbi:hypothetical protein GH714_028779 [Hevea brasiliensis]|uniref:poly(A)-specific ribonuclease n=1 Tax=Hevea brasiliensis TaxID=3981 RepID=A0A6A6LJT5_HEVBR|nr:hypothetical protein GH714_028779 [Hevea brasiliensis]